MEAVSSSWQILGVTLVLAVGLYISVLMGRLLEAGDKRSIGLYLWHTVFCAVYFLYSMGNTADSNGYFLESLSGGRNFSLGTAAVTYLTALLSSGLGLSKLGVFFVYNIFGSVGLLAFDASLRSVTANKHLQIRRFATLIILLPSVSFWSSAIGKDSLAFMATGLALWAFLNLNRRAWLAIFSVSIMLLVRPHVAALMVVAILVSLMAQSRVEIWRRLLFGGGALFCALILVPFAMDYSGLGNSATSTTLLEYIEQRQGYNMEGGGGIDISSMSLPLQMFTYLFRPLPLEAHSLTSLAVSFENVALLLFVVIGIGGWIKGRRMAAHIDWVFLSVFSMSMWVLLASTTANLGIAVRQKWMFLPMIILLFISVIGKKRKQIVGTLRSQNLRPEGIGDQGGS
jgi:hypothetical protein